MMTEAFLCDSCDEFHEGESNEVSWSVGRVIVNRFDLCDECYDEFKSVMDEFSGKEDSQ